MAFSWFTALLLLLVFASGCYSHDHEVFGYGEKVQLSLNKFQLLEAEEHQGIKQNCLSHKSRTQNGATILEMKHKDYCSGPVRDWNQKLQKRIVADNFRVKSIQSRFKHKVSTQLGSSSQAQVPITPGLKLQTLNYIVTVTLGHRNLTVIVDTGSDLTWVQCQPCRLCYNQHEPLFDPVTSQSYQSIQCISQACSSLQSATGNYGSCSSSTCNYFVTYGDGSYTRGELGKEELVLGTSSVENFVFGCGRNNKGLFGGASGLMGLGRSDLSLVSQTSEQFGGVFSYCLPDTDASTSGSLVFGGDSTVYKNTTVISYTRLIPNPELSSFYVLNLTGMSVGGVNLQSPSFGKNGILIDSGTVITRLPPSIYNTVKSEFLKQFVGYPAAPSFSILETCFNLSAYEEVDIPILKMQFEWNAEMVVHVSGMFYFVKKDASQVCLALASLSYEDEVGIIGNYQQRNTRVVYDVKQMRLGFAKEMCSFS